MEADVRRKRAGGGATLHLHGELTVQEAGRVRIELLDSLARADRVEIDLSSVTAADIAGLQLLCAAHKTAAARGKTVLLLRMPASVEEAVAVAGFGRHEGCMADCLWAGGQTDG